MNNCPAEIWSRVCAFACTDDGFTARSLSRVSRYIRDVSRPVQFHSVTLSGAYQVKCLADTLERQPLEYRRICHLYIANHNEPKDRDAYMPLDTLNTPQLFAALIYRQYHPGDEEKLRTLLPEDLRKWQQAKITKERNKAFMDALDRIVAIAAPHLQTFTLHMGVLMLGVGRGFPVVLKKYHFPLLEELTILDTSALRGGLQASDYEKLPTFPSLRRLHLVDCYNYLVAFLGAVPALTHLRMTGVTHLFPELGSIIRGVLQPDEMGPDIMPASETGLIHVERIIVSPTSRMRTVARRVITGNALKQMARGSEKLILLRPDRIAAPPYGLSEARRDWLERIEGKVGCWGYQTQDRDPDTLRNSRLGYP